MANRTGNRSKKIANPRYPLLSFRHVT